MQQIPTLMFCLSHIVYCNLGNAKKKSQVSVAKDVATLGVVKPLFQPKRKRYLFISHIERLEKAGVGTGGFWSKN